MPTLLNPRQQSCTYAVLLNIAILLFCTIPALAQSNTGTVNTNANLRAGPSTDYPIVGKATAGQQLTVAGQNAAHDWYQLSNGQWIAGFLLDLNETTAASTTVTAPTATTSPQAVSVPTGPTATTNANLRAGPGTNYPIIGSTTAGQSLTITSRTADNTWLKLASNAWIFAQLVDNVPTDLAILESPTIEPAAPAEPQPASVQPTQAQPANCDPSYPDVCIPPYPPDLDCNEIPYRRFRVIGPDRHGFDRDNDGIGCESR